MFTPKRPLKALTLAGSTALLAVLAAGGAWAQANDLVCNECVQAVDLAPNAVNNSKIANGSVNAAKLAANAVTVAKIANNSITTPKLTTASVTRQKIAPNAINSLKIANAAVTAPKIAPGAVNGTKIADKAVSFDKLAADVLLEHLLFVSADGSAANNCDDLRDALAEAGSVSTPDQKVVVRLDSGIFNCQTNGITVPSDVTLEGGGREAFGVSGKGVTRIEGEVEGALVTLEQSTVLRGLEIDNNLPSGPRDAVGVAALGGAVLKDLFVTASSNDGNAFGVTFIGSCGFGCLPRSATDVLATASSINGSVSYAFHVDGATSATLERVETFAGSLTPIAMGVRVTGGANVKVTHSELRGGDMDAFVEAGSNLQILYSQLDTASLDAKCTYVADLSNDPAAGGASACP